MMFRPRPHYALAVLAVSMLTGCTNLLARRAIIQFTDSVASADLEQVKSTTSAQFGAKALRQPEAMRDLSLMRVPQGDVKILELEPISETSKRAKVQIGKDKDHPQIVEYTLSLDPETSRWVVDDVVIGQRDERGQEIRRSVTEQMDLLLTCREFLDDWHDGPRSDKLAHCTDELFHELNTVPDVWLDGLIKEIIGSDRRQNFRPDARLNGNRAVVRLPHSEGSLFIEFQQVANQWKVQNLAIEPKNEDSTGVRSLMTLAESLNQTSRFLTAFAGGDRVAIEVCATPDFYSRCLALGDFTKITIPFAELTATQFESKQYPDRSEILLGGADGTYVVTLRRVDLTDSYGNVQKSETRVDEVTLFDPSGGGGKKFSAMLLSKSVINLFVEAMQDRDIAKLKQLSSNDFNDRVWKRDVARHFVILPYPDFGMGEPEVFATSYHGDIAEVSVEMNHVPMTFVLRLSQDLMVIDDVIIPDYSLRPSVKENLELMLPIYEFAAAIHQQDLETLIRQSGTGLDQIIWQQLNLVPEMARQLVRPMMSEVVSIDVSEEWTTVTTSDGETMAEIRMVPEGPFFRVHDVILRNQADPGVEMAFLGTVRKMISQGMILPAGARKSAVMQANLPKAVPEQVAPKANFQPISPALYQQ